MYRSHSCSKYGSLQTSTTGLFLVSAEGVRAAWIVTGLSLYGALWALALSRSFALRPTLVTANEIVVCFGLLFTLRIPRNVIRAVGRVPLPDATVVPRNAQACVFIGFTRPLEARRMLGFTKQLTAIGLHPDDVAAFELALEGSVRQSFIQSTPVPVPL